MHTRQGKGPAGGCKEFLPTGRAPNLSRYQILRDGGTTGEHRGCWAREDKRKQAEETHPLHQTSCSCPWEYRQQLGEPLASSPALHPQPPGGESAPAAPPPVLLPGGLGSPSGERGEAESTPTTNTVLLTEGTDLLLSPVALLKMLQGTGSPFLLQLQSTQSLRCRPQPVQNTPWRTDPTASLSIQPLPSLLPQLPLMHHQQHGLRDAWSSWSKEAGGV